MSTAELIYEKTRSLPEDLQTETLHYVDYLLARRQVRSEAAAGSKISAAELGKQYAPTDSVYDEDEHPA